MARPKRSGIAATLARGLLAGAAGTLAMDLLWHKRYQRGGGTDGFADWELSTGTTSFEEAGAPAQVGQHLYTAALHRPIPDRRAALTGNVVHWATGLQWGVLYALVARLRGRVTLADGLVLGPVACGAAYALLPAIDVYEPIWEYEASALWEDLTAHLVFGTACAAALRALMVGTAPHRSGRHRG